MNRLKQSTKVFIMTGFIVAFMTVAVILEVSVFNKGLKKQDNDYNYINNTVFDNQLPVIKEEVADEVIIKPFTDKNVKVVRNFYDYNGEEDKQNDSIYYYGYTYMQNEGIDYNNGEAFEVVSILDGKVLEITNDEIFGITAKVDHGNGIISVYQSLGEVNVKPNDAIKKGTVIGKSGTSIIDNDDNSYLHFELIINDVNVNPDLYYDKSLKDI